jgi:hypothetical protein
LAFAEFLRRIVDGEVTPEEAVRAYHGVLAQLGIKPHRSLADDLELQSGVMSYGGGSSASVPPGMARVKPSSRPAAKHDCGCGGSKPTECQCHDHEKSASKTTASTSSSPSSNDQPDFARMTPAEKLAYNQARRDRIFG